MDYTDNAEKVIEKARRRFSEFKATIKEMGDVAIIDWCEPGKISYRLRFTIDFERGSVMITGDLGEGVILWLSEITLEEIERITSSSGGIMHTISEHIVASSCRKYVVTAEDVIFDINNMDEYDREKINEAMEKAYTDLDEISAFLASFDENPFNLDNYEYERVYEFNKRVNEEFDYDICTEDFGKRLTQPPIFWTVGLHMAICQILGKDCEK